MALNRFAEARALVDEARARELDSIGLRRAAYTLAFLGNDSSAMARELKAARGTTTEMWTSSWEARTSLFAGRFEAAHELFQRSVQDALRDNFRELGAQWTMEDAEAHAIAGQCAEARREAAAGIELSRDNFTLERAARTLALCDAGSQASALAHELASRFSNAALTTRIQLPVTNAALALRRGESARALELLGAVAPYDHAPSSEFWPPYLRGLAYLQLKNGHAAGAQFESILKNRGQAPTSPLYPLAHLGVARAAVLTGDVASARTSYERLFSLWNGADSTLQPLKEARFEYGRLQ